MKIILLAVALCFVLGTGGPFAKADDKVSAEKAAKPDTAETQDAKEEAKEETKKAEKSSAGSVSCKLGGETRTLTKKDAEGGGCEVIYSKGGEDKSIAQAKNDLTYCDKTIDKMKEKLTTAGYTCE